MRMNNLIRKLIMRRSALAVLLLLGTASAAPASAAPAAPEAKIAWSVALNVPVYMPPQAKDGKIFLTSMQPTGPNVFALGDKGQVVWSYATQGAVSIPPTVGTAQVFVASDIGQTHFLRSLNAKNGYLIWQYTRNQPPECMCSQASIVSGNMLFAQSDGHSLYAFAPNGAAPSKRVWQFPGNGAPLTSPVVADGLVVFGSGDHNVYALDAATGKVKWSASTGYGFSAAPLVAGGVVVIGDTGGNIDGFDLQTGKSLWSFGAAAAVTQPAVAGHGLAYAVSEDHSIYALDLKTGNTVWQVAMDDYSEFSPLLAGRLVVVANRAGELLGFDAASGKPAWRTELAAVPFSQPKFWPAQNAIVLKLADHDIAAFSAASGAPLWRYHSGAVLTDPAVDGGTIVAGTSAGQVLGLE